MPVFSSEFHRFACEDSTNMIVLFWLMTYGFVMFIKLEQPGSSWSLCSVLSAFLVVLSYSNFFKFVLDY
jgi:hypothetical protein